MVGNDPHAETEIGFLIGPIQHQDNGNKDQQDAIAGH